MDDNTKLTKKDNSEQPLVLNVDSVTDNATMIGKVGKYESHNNYIFIQNQGKQPVPIYDQATEFDYSYYNLIVAGYETFGDRVFEIAKERVLTQDTSKEIADTCRAMTPEAILRLKSFPTVFAAENMDNGNPASGQMAYLGFITDIVEGGRTYKIYCQILSSIPQQVLRDLVAELRINDYRYGELNWTHWSVKNVNLIETLQKAGHQVRF